MLLIHISLKAHRCVIQTWNLLIALETSIFNEFQLVSSRDSFIWWNTGYKHMQRVRDFSSYFFLSSTHKLSNESMAFPVNTIWLLQSLRASQRPIKAIELLHTFNLAHASAEFSSQMGILCFSPSDQLTRHPLRLPLCLASASDSLHPDMRSGCRAAYWKDTRSHFTRPRVSFK